MVLRAAAAEGLGQRRPARVHQERIAGRLGIAHHRVDHVVAPGRMQRPEERPERRGAGADPVAERRHRLHQAVDHGLVVLRRDEAGVQRHGVGRLRVVRVPRTPGSVGVQVLGVVLLLQARREPAVLLDVGGLPEHVGDLHHRAHVLVVAVVDDGLRVGGLRGRPVAQAEEVAAVGCLGRRLVVEPLAHRAVVLAHRPGVAVHPVELPRDPDHRAAPVGLVEEPPARERARDHVMELRRNVGDHPGELGDGRRRPLSRAHVRDLLRLVGLHVEERELGIDVVQVVAGVRALLAVGAVREHRLHVVLERQLADVVDRVQQRLELSKDAVSRFEACVTSTVTDFLLGAIREPGQLQVAEPVVRELGVPRLLAVPGQRVAVRDQPVRPRSGGRHVDRRGSSVPGRRRGSRCRTGLAGRAGAEPGERERGPEHGKHGAHDDATTQGVDVVARVGFGG